MSNSKTDPRITVLYGYFYARSLSNYYDKKLLRSTLLAAKSHCLNTKQWQRLVLFSVIHAELSNDPYDSQSDELAFLGLHSPEAADWYAKLIDATTGYHHFEPHGSELKIHRPSRVYDPKKISRALEDEGGYLVAAIVAGVKRLPFYRILKASNLP